MNEFSLQPWRWCNRDDIEEARDLCIQGHHQRSWPAHHAAELVTTGPGWAGLAGACIADIKLGICEEGSRARRKVWITSHWSATTPESSASPCPPASYTAAKSPREST